jgi:exportin-1
MVVDAVIWGCRHPMRDVADTSLKILKNFMDRVPVSPMVFAQPFLNKFFLDILRHLFSIVTDTTHYSGGSAGSL